LISLTSEERRARPHMRPILAAGGRLGLPGGWSGRASPHCVGTLNILWPAGRNNELAVQVFMPPR
jgi:hypothetical protein